MIIARLIGGLGNQMFQYAIARHLALVHDADLKLDLSEFEKYKLHSYSLQHFNIIENHASDEDLSVVESIKERHFHFNEDFKLIANDSLLNGYWQSEKYFHEIRETILSDFSVKEALSGTDLEVSKRIGDSNSVSLHIRRTDYVTGSYNDQIFDVLDLSYYQRAVEDLSARQDELKLFIFSDDPDWVRSNVNFDLPVEYVVHNNAETNYEDLRLMSLCQHNIIANSSFSWWGAWLNDHANKRVYAPVQWFNSNVRNLDSKDIVPESWTKI